MHLYTQSRIPTLFFSSFLCLSSSFNFLFLFRYFHTVAVVYLNHTAKKIAQQAHWLHNTQRIRCYNGEKTHTPNTDGFGKSLSFANNCFRNFTFSFYLFYHLFPSVHFSMLSRLIVLLRRNHFCLLRDILTAIFTPTHFSLPSYILSTLGRANTIWNYMGLCILRKKKNIHTSCRFIR